MRKSVPKKAFDASPTAERRSRELGLVDELTGLLNGDALLILGHYQAKVATRTRRPFGVLSIEVMGLGEDGELEGSEGDQALCETAELLLSTFRASDVCVRLAEGEFCVLLSEVSRARIGPQMARLRLLERLEQSRPDGGLRSRISLRTGVASFEPERGDSFEDVLARARSDAKAMSTTAAEKRADELAASAGQARLLAAR